jgi:hypothetical protein
MVKGMREYSQLISKLGRAQHKSCVENPVKSLENTLVCVDLEKKPCQLKRR